LSARVVVSATAEDRAAPYVAALRAVGLELVTVVTPPGAPEAIAGAGEVGGRERGAGDSACDLLRAEAPAHAAEALAGASGLVLCGGFDVDPGRYGEAIAPGAGVEVAPGRDALEWELLAAARAARLPVWGICRGLQVLNVFFGGTLWQDLSLRHPTLPAPPATGLPGPTYSAGRRGSEPLAPVSHEADRPPEALAHLVRVTAPASAMGEVLAREPALVNSRHHQGIRRLAPGLAVVAEAPDGLIEAVELAEPAGGSGPAGADGWWLRAVQWHPENLVAMAQQRALWQDFALAAAAAARRRLALAG
jgi:putative glutamine amidotransferase